MEASLLTDWSICADWWEHLFLLTDGSISFHRLMGTSLFHVLTWGRNVAIRYIVLQDSNPFMCCHGYYSVEIYTKRWECFTKIIIWTFTDYGVVSVQKGMTFLVIIIQCISCKNDDFILNNFYYPMNSYFLKKNTIFLCLFIWPT